MAGQADQIQLGERAGVGELEGGYRRADHVEPALGDMHGNMRDGRGIFQEEVFIVEEQPVVKEVVLQPREGAAELGMRHMENALRLDGCKRILPGRPGSGAVKRQLAVFPKKAAMIGGDRIASLVFW